MNRLGMGVITAFAIGLALLGLTCASSPRTAEPLSAATVQPERRERVINHILPKRDSSGPGPEKFEWTPIAGADHYTLGMWNDVDRLIWQRNDLASSSVEWPAGYKLDMGTYFWSVTAWGKDGPIAESGRAAFIVDR